MSDQDAYAHLQTTTDDADEAAPAPPDEAPEEEGQDWRDVVRERANEPRDLAAEPPPVLEEPDPVQELSLGEPNMGKLDAVLSAMTQAAVNYDEGEQLDEWTGDDYDGTSMSTLGAAITAIATSAEQDFVADRGLIAVDQHSDQVSKELADLRALRKRINFRIKHLVVYQEAFESMERIAAKARGRISALEDDEPEADE